MVGAIKEEHRGKLESILLSAKKSCLVVNTDAVSANKKVVKYFAGTLPLRILILWIRCLQHQAALIVASVSLLLNIVGPLFRCTKMLKHGDHLVKLEKKVWAVLDAELI